MFGMEKEDLDWFEIRKAEYLENGESLQKAVELAADDMVIRIFGMSNEEAKAARFFDKVRELQRDERQKFCCVCKGMEVM